MIDFTFEMERIKENNIEQKRLIAKETCDSAVSFFKVSPQNVFLRIEEVNREDYSRNGEIRDLAPRLYVLYAKPYPQEVIEGFTAEMAEKLSKMLTLAKKDIHIFFSEVKKDENDLRLAGFFMA